MSKGNMLLGYAGGSVGDVTFARIKGQQTAHARNRQPANPRTTKQVNQRALFADAVKFFVQGNQNFFKFAFEDKKTTESDYNAFMRNNAKRGVVISKEAYQNVGYPALGNFMFTKGSLPVVATDWDGDSIYVFDDEGLKGNSNAQTIGAVSQAIIAGGAALAGDILTVVAVETTEQEGLPEISPTVGSYTTKWTIRQITIDPEDNTLLSTKGMAASWLGSSAPYTLDELQVVSIIGSADNYAICAAMITRQTDNGLLASTAEGLGNDAWNNAVTAARDESYVEKVLASWGASGSAILQGSLS